MIESGVILIDKPKGISSAKAIAIVKKRLNIKKIGHTGTLDPMATGLLVVLTGRATRLARFAEGGRKIYSGTILLGTTSDSDDITGNLINTEKVIPAQQVVLDAAKNFVGNIKQIPPQVSAVKVNGERAYRLARAGIVSELKERSVEVTSFQITAFRGPEIDFIIECSKGTYIRSLARDLGQALGCGACLSALRREASFPFEVLSAKEPEDLAVNDIKDWSLIFPDLMRVEVAKELSQKWLNGNLQTANEQLKSFSGDLVLYLDDTTGFSLGLLERKDNNWHIAVNFA